MIWLFHGVLSLAETQVWMTVSRESAAIAVFLLTLSARAESQWGPQVATGFEDNRSVASAYSQTDRHRAAAT